MATKQPLKSTTTNTKKRKSGDNLPQKSSKQPRKTLESYFTPRVSISAGTDKKTHIAQLSDEQNAVLRMVVDEGKNVFFTGSAGTGKSLLLRAIISALRKKHANKPDVVSVTASTGMAASNIGGMTIHSWGAVTPGNHNIDTQISCIKVCKPALQRWKNTKVLVIDEVSMVDGPLLDTLTALADRLRKKTDKPFGGIQLVVTGDFFQLPPVSKGQPAIFAFESGAWKTCIDHTVNLTRVFRQKDNHFISVLNEMRQGTISPGAISTFKSLCRQLPPPPPSMPNILPTELFPLRREVSDANSARLRALPHSLHVFDSHDTFPGLSSSSSASNTKTKPVSSSTQHKHEGLLSGILAEKRLELKRGAQVMLVKNVDEILVNGCVGRVVGFWTYREVCVANGNQKVGSGSALKTTGAVRNVKLDLNGELVTTSGKENAPENKENVPGDKVPSKAKPKMNPKDEERFPVIEFPTPEGGKEAVLLMRDEFRVEDSEGKLLARRMQVPLILAWAMSIHKSQGQTIQRVKVDLGKVFEKGQSYVALSRAASLEGLQVLRFDPRKVMAHPKVIEWSKALLVVKKDTE